MEKTILVLGGGIGGIRTARELNKLIGNEDEVTLAKILVFEKEKTSLFAPSLTKLMVGQRDSVQIQDDLTNIELGGIEVVHGEVEAVDPENVTVTSGGTEYKGDYMVVSLGTEQHDIHNLSKAGHNFYTAEGASAFYDQLKTFSGGKIAIVVSSLPYKSPVAPYEAAMLTDQYLRENGLRDKTELAIYTPESMPMPFAGDKVSEHIRSLMKEKGITYHSGHELTRTDENTLYFKDENGNEVGAELDLMAYTPDHRCPTVIQKSGLAGKSGWVDVNAATLQTSYENVYAIGDITRIPLSERDNLPKAGVFAQYQALTVANNIVRQIHGKDPDKVFTAQGKYILYQGNGKASRVGGDFYSSNLDLKETSAINHWMKTLQEKAWFASHF